MNNGKGNSKDQKEEKYIFDGIVTEVLPEGKFRVKIKVEDSEQLMLCYQSGKMRLHYIRLIVGDSVKVEVSKYDFSKGRITTRLGARFS